MALVQQIADAMFDGALIASDNSEDAAEVAIRVTVASLARFRVDNNYNGDGGLTHDCGWEAGWSWRDDVTLGTIAEKAFAHAAECQATASGS